MDVPLQEPERYWPLAHTALEHVLHLKPLVVPAHEPVRCWPPGQLDVEQTLH